MFDKVLELHEATAAVGCIAHKKTKFKGWRQIKNRSIPLLCFG
jgi:hypothetical protein